MSIKALPEDYVFYDKIDLKNNKKQFWTVQGVAVAIALVMFVSGWFVVSFSDTVKKLYEGDKYESIEAIIACVVLIFGYILYIIAHEATHAVFMYAFGKVKVKFGFIGWAAYAGSSAFFNKKQYVIISLAPLMLWGAVFAILNAFFHTGIWFWVIWLLQIGNVSGAAGDLFCAFKMTGYPAEILVNDTGTEMSVYRKMTEDEIVSTVNVEEQPSENNGENID